MTGRIFVEKPSPWSVMDEYDPQLHPNDDTYYRLAPPAQRWLAFLIVMAVVCAIVAVLSAL